MTKLQFSIVLVVVAVSGVVGGGIVASLLTGRSVQEGEAPQGEDGDQVAGQAEPDRHLTPRRTQRSHTQRETTGEEDAAAERARQWFAEQDAAREAAAYNRKCITERAEQLLLEFLTAKVSCMPAFFKPGEATQRDDGRILSGMATEAHQQALRQTAQEYGVRAAEVQQAWAEDYGRPSDGRYPPSVTLSSFGIRASSVDFLPVWGMFTVGKLAGYYAAVSHGGVQRAGIMRSIVRGEGETNARVIFRRLGWQ